MYIVNLPVSEDIYQARGTANLRWWPFLDDDTIYPYVVTNDRLSFVDPEPLLCACSPQFDLPAVATTVRAAAIARAARKLRKIENRDLVEQSIQIQSSDDETLLHPIAFYKYRYSCGI